MPRLFFALFLVLQISSEVSAELKEIQTETAVPPLERLEKDWAAGDARFLAVGGYAMDCPGLDAPEVSACIVCDRDKWRVIDPTSDVILSEEHGKLKKKAFGYAATYNQALGKRLIATGKTVCKPEEDWQGFAAQVWELAAHDPSFRFLAHPQSEQDDLKQPSASIVNIYVVDQKIKGEILAKICLLAATNQISRPISIEVKLVSEMGKPGRDRGDAQAIACNQ